MISVPTAPLAHLAVDIVAWGAGLALGVGLYRWRLRGATERLATSTGPGYLAALGLGAAIGAWAAGSLNTLQGPAPALSHSILGALAGAIASVEAYKLACGMRGSTGAVFVGPFALGAVLGRWGCLFTGLSDRTYGVPTALPWAVDLGDGVGRHPVQVYESIAMAAFLALFLAGLSRRSAWTVRRGFYVMCVWYGVQRFAWEFLKPYPAVIGPLNLFHLLSLGLVAYGLAFWSADRRAEAAAARVA